MAVKKGMVAISSLFIQFPKFFRHVKGSDEHYMIIYIFLKKVTLKMQKSEEENDQIFIYYTYGLKKYTSGTPDLSWCQIYTLFTINTFALWMKDAMRRLGECFLMNSVSTEYIESRGFTPYTLITLMHSIA